MIMATDCMTNCADFNFCMDHKLRRDLLECCQKIHTNCLCAPHLTIKKITALNFDLSVRCRTLGVDEKYGIFVTHDSAENGQQTVKLTLNETKTPKAIPLLKDIYASLEKLKKLKETTF